MSNSHYLQPLQLEHHGEVKEVYQEAIENLGHIFYSEEQIQAWSTLAILPGVLDESLHKGKGWISLKKNKIVAFALRYPPDRLALLYCRSDFGRSGHATALLRHIELEAFQEGLKSLSTEASSFSYPLLLKLGWFLIKPELIQIADIIFKRYRMQKQLISENID